ncbi:hypothetical protein LJC32_02710 [Oscillospiraceae bacterium OttesenSCG-928-F05]|nr:hypothetical protein [Oscillospiraceae bacterium OttesenSCG-928-F05]
MAAKSDKVPLEAIKDLASRKHVTGAVLRGVCAAYGWHPERRITEVEFDRACADYLKAPIGKAVKTC